MKSKIADSEISQYNLASFSLSNSINLTFSKECRFLEKKLEFFVSKSKSNGYSLSLNLKN